MIAPRQRDALQIHIDQLDRLLRHSAHNDSVDQKKKGVIFAIKYKGNLNYKSIRSVVVATGDYACYTMHNSYFNFN